MEGFSGDSAESVARISASPKHQDEVLAPEVVPRKKEGAVDIAILQVKIGLNFGTCKAEFERDDWAGGFVTLRHF